MQARLSYWLRCGSFLLASLMTTAATAQGFAEKDLAIALGRSPTQAIRFQNPGYRDFMPAVWYQQVLAGFRQTPIGPALERENLPSDWQLVAIRIAPCMPLGLMPKDQVSEHCWPEVRLVWQPFVAVGPERSPFADDRAIHAIYDVFPSDALTAEELRRVIELRNRLYAYYRGFRDPAYLLNDAEEYEYQTLRNKVVSRLLGNTLWLRSLDASQTQAYSGHGLRPELASGSQTVFRNRLLAWLSAYTPSNLLKEMTAFSLPLGRAPGRINVWSFIAFDNDGGVLKQRDLTIQSAVDARTLFNFGRHETVTRQQEDRRLLMSVFSPDEAREINQSVILNAVDRPRLLPNIADRNQVLVANTSCASCHRFQRDLNNFHNFSYFVGEAQISRAARVEQDVAWDLSWLRARFAAPIAFRSLLVD